MYLHEDIPKTEILYDDHKNRVSGAEPAETRVGPHMNKVDLKCEIPEELPENEYRKWASQRYIQEYLRVVASIDDNVKRLLYM